MSWCVGAPLLNGDLNDQALLVNIADSPELSPADGVCGASLVAVCTAAAAAVAVGGAGGAGRGLDEDFELQQTRFHK